MLRIIRFAVVVIVVISGLALHLRNDQPVVFDYYLDSLALPFSLYLILSLCAGIALGILMLLPLLLHLKAEKHRLTSRVRLHEQELDNLRAMPLKNTY